MQGLAINVSRELFLYFLKKQGSMFIVIDVGGQTNGTALIMVLNFIRIDHF